MSDNNGGSKIVIFLAGLGIGAIIALLFAPTTGEETREFISKKAGEGREYLEGRGREIRRQTQDVMDRSVRAANEWADRGKGLADKGKGLVAKATN